MSSPYFLRLINSVLMQAVQPSVRVPHVLGFYIPVPPKREQDEISGKLETANNTTLKLSDSIKSNSELKMSVLNNYMMSEWYV